MLGHNWLTCFNPLIDRVLGSITFHSPLQTDSLTSPETVASGVPSDYHNFTDIFSKTHACTPAPHWPYDLKIELEEGTSPPFSLIYSLSESELKSLWEFLDEHLVMDFIHPSRSPGRAPVLFACKKDGLLQLCVDFHGLNKITKKD